MYEPSVDHEYDYTKVEKTNKPAAPAEDLEYDYAKTDDVKSAINSLPVKGNHYQNQDISNQNASKKTTEKKEPEKDNDGGPLYETLDNDTVPVYQTLEEE